MRYSIPILLVLFGLLWACKAAEDRRRDEGVAAILAAARADTDPFAPSAIERAVGALLEDAPDPTVYAIATIRHPASSCDVLGGGMHVQFSARPIVGRPWWATWVTRPTSPPEPPDYALAALIVSQRRSAGAPLPDGSGCWLMVQPDIVLAPGPIWRRDGGIYWLEVTWPRELLGSPWFMQALLADGRARGGVVTSAMLEIVVGNR